MKSMFGKGISGIAILCMLISACLLQVRPAYAADPLDVTGSLSTPQPPEIVKLAGGEEHSVALKSDGTVWTWGSYGAQLGHYYDGLYPRRVDFHDPVTGELLGPVTDIAAGNSFSLAVIGGQVWAWGYNWSGQLGNGGYQESAVPARVLTGPGTPLNQVVKVSAGMTHALAMTEDKRVWSWGYNDAGQVGNGDESGEDVFYAQPVQAGGSGDLTGVTDIAAGSLHSMALTDDHKVHTWGYNFYGQAGGAHSVTKATYAWPIPGELLPPVSKIYTGSGSDSSYAVTTNDEVYAWGYNYSGQLGDGSWSDQSIPVKVTVGDPGSKVIAIAAGSLHTVALLDNGTVWGTGTNGNSQLARDSNTGNLLGFVNLGLVNPSDSSPMIVKGISAGNYNTFVLNSDMLVYGFGSNYNQELGIGDDTRSDHVSPTPLLALTEDHHHTVSGVMLHKVTGAPIANAPIYLDGYESGVLRTVTNTDGSFLFKGVFEDEYTFRIDETAEQYYPLPEESFDVSSNVSDNVVYAVPTTEPTMMMFEDESGLPGIVNGILYWQGPEISSVPMDLYFVDSIGQKVGEKIAEVNETTYYYMMNKAVPDGAAGLRLFIGDQPTDAWTLLYEYPSQVPTQLRMTDLDDSAGTIIPKVSWKGVPEESLVSKYVLIHKRNTSDGEDTVGTYYISPLGATDYSYTGLNSILLEDWFELFYIDSHNRYSPNWNIPVYDLHLSASIGTNIDSTLPKPSFVDFTDLDLDADTIGGRVTWTFNSTVATSVQGYKLYFADENGGRLQSIGSVLGSEYGGNYDFLIPDNTPIPSNAVRIGVAAWSEAGAEGPIDTSNAIQIKDLRPEVPAPSGVMLEDVYLSGRSVSGTIQWNQASDETGVVGYSLYFYDQYGLAIQPLDFIEKTGGSVYTFSFDSSLPRGAIGIGVSTQAEVARSVLGTVPFPEPGAQTPQVFFSDMDWSSGEAGGWVYWEPLLDESSIERYEAYFIDAAGVIVGSKLGQAIPDEEYPIQVPDHTAIPPGAVQIAVFAVTAGSEGPVNNLVGSVSFEDLKIEDDEDPASFGMEDMVYLLDHGILDETEIHYYLNHLVTPRNAGFTPYHPYYY